MNTLVQRVLSLISSWKLNQDSQSQHHYHLQQDLNNTTTTTTTSQGGGANHTNGTQIEIDQISNTSSTTSELINLSAYPLAPLSATATAATTAAASTTRRQHLLPDETTAATDVSANIGVLTNATSTSNHYYYAINDTSAPCSRLTTNTGSATATLINNPTSTIENNIINHSNAVDGSNESQYEMTGSGGGGVGVYEDEDQTTNLASMAMTPIVNTAASANEDASHSTARHRSSSVQQQQQQQQQASSRRSVAGRFFRGANLGPLVNRSSRQQRTSRVGRANTELSTSSASSSLSSASSQHAQHQQQQTSQQQRNQYDLFSGFKKRERNLLSACCAIFCIAILAVSLVETRWFYLNGGGCNVNYLGVAHFFAPGRLEYQREINKVFNKEILVYSFILPNGFGNFFFLLTYIFILEHFN
jgi:hypothetical protein